MRSKDRAEQQTADQKPATTQYLKPGSGKLPPDPNAPQKPAPPTKKKR